MRAWSAHNPLVTHLSWVVMGVGWPLSLYILFPSCCSGICSLCFVYHSPCSTSLSRQTAQRSSRSNMEMRARVCDLLGKRPNRQARVVTFSHKRNKTVQHVNLQTKRYFSDELGRNVKLRLSTKGMKTVTKYGGVDAAAKKFGLDLTKF